ncbi:MAG: ParB/RepB/Spo0J family partition protein [Ktedonobacteraceae bacterium]
MEKELGPAGMGEPQDGSRRASPMLHPSPSHSEKHHLFSHPRVILGLASACRRGSPHCAKRKDVMSKTPQQSLLDATEATFAEQQQEILSRLQIKVLPYHETRALPLECILVPDEARVHVPKSLVQSIKRFGVLQAPTVVRCSAPEKAEESAHYEVIAGRRRTKGARLAGLTDLTCEVYASSTPQLNALLALIENTQRSSAWIKEVADLRVLIDQRVGMTVPELIACGFARVGLDQRLKMAQLPAPLLDRIVAGKVPLDVARMLVRLSESQRARVVQEAQDAPLTAELVKQALKVQISADLSPLQIVFPTWDMQGFASSSSSARDPWVLDEEESDEREEVQAEKGGNAENQSLLDLLTALQVFTYSDAYSHMEDAHLLIQALIQHLEVTGRTHAVPTEQPQ